MYLYCPIRQLKVCATPEEKLRQSLIDEMGKSLGFPLSQMAVEKELHALCPKAHSLPNRRVDILVFAPSKSKAWELSPLLLVECKQKEVTKQALDQALGYNHFLQAPFITIAAPNSKKTFWKSNKKMQSVDFLPNYSELLTFVN